jgi:hypothetical protein
LSRWRVGRAAPWGARMGGPRKGYNNIHKHNHPLKIKNPYLNNLHSELNNSCFKNKLISASIKSFMQIS